jgi:hypothetical protein
MGGRIGALRLDPSTQPGRYVVARVSWLTAAAE